MSKKLKTTITLAQHIKDFASKEAEALGLDFSAYITVLIGEKMRGISLAPTSVSQVNTAISEVAITVNEEVEEDFSIDNEQANEIDRLLDM